MLCNFVDNNVLILPVLFKDKSTPIACNVTKADEINNVQITINKAVEIFSRKKHTSIWPYVKNNSVNYILLWLWPVIYFLNEYIIFVLHCTVYVTKKWNENLCQYDWIIQHHKTILKYLYWLFVRSMITFIG